MTQCHHSKAIPPTHQYKARKHNTHRRALYELGSSLRQAQVSCGFLRSVANMCTHYLVAELCHTWMKDDTHTHMHARTHTHTHTHTHTRITFNLTLDFSLVCQNPQLKFIHNSSSQPPYNNIFNPPGRNKHHF